MLYLESANGAIAIKNYFVIAHTYPSPPVPLQFSTISRLALACDRLSQVRIRFPFRPGYVCCREMETEAINKLVLCYAISLPPLASETACRQQKSLLVAAKTIETRPVARQRPTKFFQPGETSSDSPNCIHECMKYSSNWRFSIRKKFGRKCAEDSSWEYKYSKYAHTSTAWHWKCTRK